MIEHPAYAPQPYAVGAHFASGVANSRNEEMPSSLEEKSAVYNAQVPHAYVPRSVLAQYKPSDNGMSSRDYGRMLPGPSGKMLPTTNGVSDPSNDTQTQLRMAGGLPL